MGWEIQVLEGVAGCAAEIEAGMAEATYLITSSTPVDALLVDSTVLAKLTEMSGVEIAPLVNSLGETIGYTAKAAAASNGATALSNTWVDIVKTSTTVTQEMIDAAVPMIEGGTTADLAVGDTITTLGLDAASGVGGAAGTGVGATALGTVAGPAIAVALGVAAGTALYNIAPQFWTDVEQKLEAAGKMIGGKVISWFKTDGTEYYDDETISIIADALIDSGYLSRMGTGEATPPDGLTLRVTTPVPYGDGAAIVLNVDTSEMGFVAPGAKICLAKYGLYGGAVIAAASTSGIVLSGDTIGNVNLASTWTYNDLTVWYGSAGIRSTWGNSAPRVCFDGSSALAPDWRPVAWTLVYGTTSGQPKPNDLPQEENGDPNKKVSPVPTSVTDPLHDPTTDPNHKKRKHYDPTPGKKTDPEDDPEPQVDPNPQPDPEPTPDPNPTPDPEYPEDPKDPNPDTPDNEDEGHDPDPPPVVPIAATALSRVYNPSQSEVDALGQYLWNSVNIQDILGIFNSPIDGIIGFMKLYAKPDIGASREIKLGYLSTGVSASVVEHQTVTVNCGVVRIPLSKNNATDYPPYTTVQIYLPFIGIKPLNGYDLVGSQLACIYHIDCYTGACVAQLKVTRDNMTAKLYEFSGNCAQQLPLTSGNFHQIAGNLISGVIAGGVTGGAAGAVMGTAQTLAHSNIEVGRSGNLSANAGMLGTRTPYLIITRAISADAANYAHFYGYPTNKTVYLRNCRGYVRVKDIILHTSATEAEKAEIEELLKKGVYI